MLLIHVCCDGSSWNRLVDLSQLSAPLAGKITQAQKRARKELTIDNDEFDEIEAEGVNHTWPGMVDDEVTVYVE